MAEEVRKKLTKIDGFVTLYRCWCKQGRCNMTEEILQEVLTEESEQELRILMSSTGSED